MIDLKDINIEPAKKWYASKTLWVNAIAILAIVLQSVTGSEVLDTDAQAIVLAVINMVLRAITRVPLV